MGMFSTFLGGLFGLGQVGLQNAANERIAKENLEYQKERNEIEDARYSEETAYNRAFAENERKYNRAFAEDERAYNRAFAEDERAYNRQFAEEERAYNRALQQEIFRREDTAIARQAESLSKLGINPLSQNMNGLNAGQVISSSAPSSVGSPSTSSHPSSVAASSSRGGQALHNNMKYEFSLAPILGMLDTINGIQTGEYSRDKLQLENDRMFLENALLANEMGIDYTPNLGFKNKFKDSKGSVLGIKNDDGSKLKWSETSTARFQRDNKNLEENQKYFSLKHKMYSGIYDGADSRLNYLRELSTTDFSKIAEDFLTNIVKSYSEIGNDFQKRFGGKSSFADKFIDLLF